MREIPPEFLFFRLRDQVNRRSRDWATTHFGFVQENAMGTRGTKIREAIAHLATDGCDLTDPSIKGDLRSDEARFHLGYLEEDCGFRLSIDEVLVIARTMMREGGVAQASGNGHTAVRRSTPPQSRHYYN
jgi:hypothetical protein